jgi:uncharacterized protein YciI
MARSQVVVPASPAVAARVFAAHFGDSPEIAEFAPVGDHATLVTGGEHLLNGYPAAVPGEFTGDEPLVIVLRHDTARGVANLFEHPLFGAHARFLAALSEQGILVGAGPFAGTGQGMAIVRVAGAAAAAEVVRAAQFDDESVTGGLLEVLARPWVVMMHGSSLA